MRYREEHDIIKGERTLTLTLSDDDLGRARLDAMDLRLLQECAESNSIADKLLAAQTVAFRLEQALSGKD